MLGCPSLVALGWPGPLLYTPRVYTPHRTKLDKGEKEREERKKKTLFCMGWLLIEGVFFFSATLYAPIQSNPSLFSCPAFTTVLSPLCHCPSLFSFLPLFFLFFSFLFSLRFLPSHPRTTSSLLLVHHHISIILAPSHTPSSSSSSSSSLLSSRFTRHHPTHSPRTPTCP